MFGWEITVNILAEKVYHVILNRIKAGLIDKKDKVKLSLEPSYIKVIPGASLFTLTVHGLSSI